MTDYPVRPPTILSEYGEGYCRHCHFIEGLTFQGLLSEHYRGKIMHASWSNADGPKPCKGSLRRPDKLTPHTSKLAAFRVTAPTGVCNICLSVVPYHPTGGIHGEKVLDRHFALGTACTGSYKPPAVS